MTALEDHLRATLRSWPVPLPDQRDPDPWVFGPPQPVREPAEGSTITGSCRWHDVEWGGYGRGCWCCEAHMPALKTN